MLHGREVAGGGVTLEISIHAGRDLIAKDKKLFGLGKKSSDPYVCVLSLNYGSDDAWSLLTPSEKPRRLTSTKFKTLAPTWNDPAFKLHLDMEQTRKLSQKQSSSFVLLTIYDEDKTSADDCMGIVRVPIMLEQECNTNGGTPQWYPVEAGNPSQPSHYCRNASGQLQVSVVPVAFRSMQLTRGNVHPIRHSQVQAGLSWNVEQHGIVVDLDVSCVAIDRQGHVLMAETVYYGNLSNSNRSVYHTGDETTGATAGDDEMINFDFSRVPSNVLAMYLILSVVTPGKTLEDVRSAAVQLYSIADDTNENSVGRQCFCVFQPAALGGAHTSLFLARFSRELPNQWNFSPIEEGDRVARDFGTLIPQVKSLSQDLISDIVVNPDERVAILRKGGVIRLEDYSHDHRIPEWVTLGLAWDVTNGTNIDLDASVICLDENLDCHEIVYFRKLISDDKAIQHCGDEREGDEIGDDEKINVSLSKVDSRIKYLAFVINSYSGQELDDVSMASCHLFDTHSKLDMASYSITSSRQLDKHTALIMACLYRANTNEQGESEWSLLIVSEAADGRTAKDNVDEVQNFLRQNPPPPPSRTTALEEQDIDLRMPVHVPHVDEEIQVVPFSVLVDEEIVL
jgi:tellurium resistance protein TerZ